MMRLPTRNAGSARRLLVRAMVAGTIASAMGVFALAAHSTGPVPKGPTTMAASEPIHAEKGTRWQELKPAQQTALRPLEQKWIALSSRFSKLTPAEQARVQERETQWAKLTPLERGQARLHFQEAKELPKEDRQARWDAYQALSPERKRELAARAAPNPARPGIPAPAKVDKPPYELPVAKSNIGAAPNATAPPRAIAATVVQAGPGATTTSVARRPTPPSHQPAGMPKIAATSGFVNKATLLPQSGPQRAATRSAAGPSIERAPQR
jgi:hypothetical protein